jgi:RNase P/RNase MRP subunit POP5
MHEGADVLGQVQKRHAELFGSVASQRASLRLIKDEDGTAILRTSLEEAESVLAAIALCDPPVLTTDMSSSMKRLKRRL